MQTTTTTTKIQNRQRLPSVYGYSDTIDLSTATADNTTESTTPFKRTQIMFFNGFGDLLYSTETLKKKFDFKPVFRAGFPLSVAG